MLFALRNQRKTKADFFQMRATKSILQMCHSNVKRNSLNKRTIWKYLAFSKLCILLVYQIFVLRNSVLQRELILPFKSPE